MLKCSSCIRGEETALERWLRCVQMGKHGVGRLCPSITSMCLDLECCSWPRCARVCGGVVTSRREPACLGGHHTAPPRLLQTSPGLGSCPSTADPL